MIGLVSLKDILEKICGQEMIDDDDHQFKTLLSRNFFESNIGKKSKFGLKKVPE